MAITPKKLYAVFAAELGTSIQFEQISSQTQAAWLRACDYINDVHARGAEHEQEAKKYVADLEALMVDMIRLRTSPEASARLFEARTQLIDDLRSLLREEYRRGAAQGRRNMAKALRCAIDYEERE